MGETAADKVERTRREQGLPPRIVDLRHYDRTAAALEDRPHEVAKAA